MPGVRLRCYGEVRRGSIGPLGIEKLTPQLADDSSLGPDHFMRLWSQTFVDCGEMQGKTFKIAHLAKNYIEEAVLPALLSLHYDFMESKFSTKRQRARNGKTLTKNF